MRKKYRDLIAISYPMSNRAYVVAVNNEVLNNEGLPSNNDVDISSGLEPQTIVILEAAGLFNNANRVIK